MLAGLVCTHLVTVDEGAPDGDILLALYSLGGAEMATGSVTPAVDAVSAIITVGGAHNQLAGEYMRSIRELVMSYAVGGVSRTEVVEYVIEGRVPFAVSARGVREKLGVSPQDLPEQEIDKIGRAWCRERVCQYV